MSLNQDPADEDDEETPQQDGKGAKSLRESLKYKSMRPDGYKGDNLIEVDSAQAKKWKEPSEVEESGEAGPMIEVDNLESEGSRDGPIETVPSGSRGQSSLTSPSGDKSFKLLKKGSVVAKIRKQGPEIRTTHVEEELERRKTELRRSMEAGELNAEGQELPDQLFIATRIKNIFKRTQEDGVLNTCWLVVEVPLNFLRNYSTPMADNADWDRCRASILPLTVPISFFYLQKYLAEGEDIQTILTICAILLAPGAIISIYIRCRTTLTRPPVIIMFVFAIIGFLMSICWISFTSDIVIDILEILGIMLQVPPSVLGLTLLAWGNCLGDMNADVAMTKKGFGEMAITGCMAGPVFNILMGLGLSMVAVFLKNPD